MSSNASQYRHVLVFREEFSYCAHPHIVIAQNGTWVAVFNRAPRKSFVLHPPEEPQFHNVIIRSQDEGLSWTAPQVVPECSWSGTECAGLTLFSNGRLMLNQWRFEWMPLGLASKAADQSALAYPPDFMKSWHVSPEHKTAGISPESFERIAPWVRAPGATFVHFSEDNGVSFCDSVRINTHPFSGGYGMRGAAELPDGKIILPLSDVPHYKQVFNVESCDGGQSWSAPILVASGAGHEFEEPTVLRCKSGKLLMILRDNMTRRLHQSVSLDAGKSWSMPHAIRVEGYPGHLLVLDDSRILLTYGWRQPDFSIRAVLSSDEGETWDVDHAIHIRRGMQSKNLGYPATIAVKSGGFFTLYYGEDVDGVTAIMGSYWRL